jgi:hypothetical protein
MSTALLSLSRRAAPAEPSHGTPIAEARDALAYWSRRASELRWHQRAARREARSMIATSRARLVGAHLERWGRGTIAHRLIPLVGIRGLIAGAHVRSLVWTTMRRTPIGRRILLGAAGVAAASVACLALGAALLTHLLGLWPL